MTDVTATHHALACVNSIAIKLAAACVAHPSTHKMEAIAAPMTSRHPTAPTTPGATAAGVAAAVGMVVQFLSTAAKGAVWQSAGRGWSWQTHSTPELEVPQLLGEASRSPAESVSASAVELLAAVKNVQEVTKAFAVSRVTTRDTAGTMASGCAVCL